MSETAVHTQHKRPSPYRPRRDFSKVPQVIEVPNLIEVQQRSYERFLQLDTLPEDRIEMGIQEVFASVFPITNYNETASLEFVSYEIGTWECNCGRLKGIRERYRYSCSCGQLSGVKDVLRDAALRRRECDRCSSAVSYQVCPACDTRVSFRMKNEVEECRQRGMSYTAPLKVTIRLVVWEKDPETDVKSIRDIKEQEVYLGELPIMTDVYSDEEGYIRIGDKGKFIINGTERVIVSQMHRSPGVFFTFEKQKGSTGSRILHSARIIPYRGSWIEFEFDTNDILYVRIDRKRKLPVTILLRALGMDTNEEILRTFYKTETLVRRQGQFFRPVNENLLGERLNQEIPDADGTVRVKARKKITRPTLRKLQTAGIEEFQVTREELLGKVVASEVVDADTGEILLECNDEISESNLDRLFEGRVDSFEILLMEPSRIGNTIRNTLKKDKLEAKEDPQREARIEIYRRLRPGDPLTDDSASTLFDRLFANGKYYDLSKVGRLKLNKKLQLEKSLEQRTLDEEDIVAVVSYLLKLKNNFGSVDDIDHLGNRRVRCVGELLQNQMRIGLVRMERAIKERMSIQDLATSMPHDLINSKPVTSTIREFFGSSQLSQFMDQTNPLSELTHKRRLSALGPGGLSRERAGFEVRDVHPTHYGRICPIETPEGPNVGLISSLSVYARINELGFIETPYRKVVDIIVQKSIEYLTALDEDWGRVQGKDDAQYVIVNANAKVDRHGRLVDERVSARAGGDFIVKGREEVNYMDVSPKQLVSVSTSLIPFLDHDDANRALMGSNMQRQAVPLLKTEAPIVGTGMEYTAAYDSGVVVIARRGGTVESVSADRIIIRVDPVELSEGPAFEPAVDIYRLIKFQRTNQNTCKNQVPIVRLGAKVTKGQIIADGPATDRGELALGQNVLVAFMPWGGYNFEDAILISESVVREDRFTSIHIEQFEIEARDTKLGKEEITADIPNVSEEKLKNLDSSGIIRIGAEVKPGDILVGKVTPKGETQLTPEEKLLRAIFGEKAGDVRDASLVTPPGIEGTVIDVKVFARKGVDKDARSLAIERMEIEKIDRDQADEVKILQENALEKIRAWLVGHPSKAKQSLTSGGEVKKGQKLDRATLSGMVEEDLHKVLVADPQVNQRIKDLWKKMGEQIEITDAIYDAKKKKLQKGDELPPGVIKLVKVYVAVKRKLSVGDKMAGRHGNKGVISRILPIEDMPCLPDGTPVEIVLNPLGVPSRMNVGQILETHLGWAAKALGQYVATPVFDGASENEVKTQLEAAHLPRHGQIPLFDGRTGDLFENPVTVGYIYMMKLAHLVDNKIHARSIGPYSLVTQQPLGGKAQFGGQRFGEMEVWALEAYGAAHTLQELLTVKSDDVQGRTKMYQAIVKGESMGPPGMPESFNVLFKEMQSLCLDVELVETSKGRKPQ
jgi:DNA-directed RNA polymerase subunit beta